LKADRAPQLKASVGRLRLWSVEKEKIQMAVYRVVFDCVPCERRHPTGILKQFSDSNLDGRPLSEVYQLLGRDIHEEIKTFDPGMIRCNGQIVKPEPEHFFLAVPL
jgi:hypothetical protein